MDAILSIDDFVDMIRRRFWVIVMVILLGCLASLFFALSRTHLYESSEVIQVAQPKVDDELAPTTVGGSSARRLQLIQQQLMTRGTVLEIVDKFHLFSDVPDLKSSQKVAILRQAVSIHGVAAAREGFTDDGTVSVITITAQMDTPDLAQKVAHEFATRTLELSALSRTAKARETLSFFQSEEEKLIAQIDLLDKDLTAFTRDNDIAIEGNLEFRQSQMAAINSALLEIDREKVSLKRDLAELDTGQRAATLAKQKREIDAQLQSLDAQRRLLEDRVAGLTQAIGTTPKVERELNAFDRRREKLQGQLDVVSTRRSEAEVGYKLEEQRHAERLTVIEPASLPDYPVTPSRKKTAVMGGLASIVFGIVAAFLLDLRKPVVRSAEQMQRQLGITPVVVIPVLDAKPVKKPHGVAGFGRMIAEILRAIRSSEPANGAR